MKNDEETVPCETCGVSTTKTSARAASKLIVAPMKYRRHSTEWYAERAAQAVYDLRDALPVGEKHAILWAKYDRIANQLTRYGARLAKEAGRRKP